MRTYVRDRPASRSRPLPPSDRASSTLARGGRRSDLRTCRSRTRCGLSICTRARIAEVREGSAAVARAVHHRGLAEAAALRGNHSDWPSARRWPFLIRGSRAMRRAALYRAGPTILLSARRSSREGDERGSLLLAPRTTKSSPESPVPANPPAPRPSHRSPPPTDRNASRRVRVEVPTTIANLASYLRIRSCQSCSETSLAMELS